MNMIVSPISLETVTSVLEGLAPDGGLDPIRTLGDDALDGLGQLSVSLAVPSASAIITVIVVITNSSTRVTAHTPSAGTRVRVMSCSYEFNGTTNVGGELYYGTGASGQTNPGSAIAGVRMDIVDNCSQFINFADGQCQVGAVDEVLSVRVGAALAGETMTWNIQLREE